MPVDGSHLQRKHVAMNKFIKIRTVCGCEYKCFRFVNTNSDVSS